MKTVKIVVVFVFVSISLQVKAQLKVLSTGRVDIYNQHVISGTINSDVLDIVNSATNLSSGCDMIWANYNYSQPNNPGLLKLATASSAKFVVKSNGYVGICKTYPSCELDIVGTGRINGNLIWSSDVRLKDNILPVENSNEIFKLTGVNYNFKQSTEDVDFKDKDFLLEKDSIKVMKNEADPKFYSRKHIGFIAQDVQLLFPELVFEDSIGILSIDYIGFIPLIIETIKNQEERITNQEEKIKDFEARIQSLEAIVSNKKSIAESTTDEIGKDNSIPVLSQNEPNPFNQETEINFFIPELANTAILNIYTLNGTQIKNYNIVQRGYSNIVLSGAYLEPGMYLYSLIVDGIEIDTKRMILTE